MLIHARREVDDGVDENEQDDCGGERQPVCP